MTVLVVGSLCGAMDEASARYVIGCEFDSTWARILYPDLGQNLGPRPKFRTFEIFIQFHYSDLNLGLGLNIWT